MSWTDLTTIGRRPGAGLLRLPGAPPAVPLSAPRTIAHVDLDCFFVSVERVLDPIGLGGIRATLALDATAGKGLELVAWRAHCKRSTRFAGRFSG